MKSVSRLGIYGGTFAPVHNGHVAMAHAFSDSGIIDKLLIMPAFLPPHKTLDFADAPTDRLNMLKLAFPKGGNEAIEVCDHELKRQRVSYTVETAEHFTVECDELVIFCGSDMLLTIESWYQARRLLGMISIAYNTRTDNGEDIRALTDMAEHLRTAYGTRCYPLNAKTVGISSSQVRNMIKAGGDISELVPRDVKRYIDEHHLYRT